MSLPKVLDDLKSLGYTFLDHGTCRDCGEDVEWWETPRQKKIPVNPMSRGDDPVVMHWTSCDTRS